jgi:hypothetical protein
MSEIVERDWADTLLWREIYDQIATWPETTRGCDSWVGGDEHHMVFCNRPAVAYAIFQGCFCYATSTIPYTRSLRRSCTPCCTVGTTTSCL